MAESMIYTIYRRLGKLARKTFEQEISEAIRQAKVSKYEYRKFMDRSNKDWIEVQALATFTISVGKIEVMAGEASLNDFKVSPSEFVQRWTREFVEANFGKDKPVKTCNVKKEYILDGKNISKHHRVESFHQWFLQNVFIDYKDIIYLLAEQAAERVIEECRSIIKRTESERRAALARYAISEIKEVMLKYRNVPQDVIQQALVESTLHSVLDF